MPEGETEAFVEDIIEKDENPAVRRAGAKKLADMETAKATKVLENITHGPMEEFKVFVSALLMAQGNDVGKSRMKDALSDSNSHIRKAAIRRLGLAGYDQITKRMVEALDDEPEVAFAAAQLLIREEEEKERAEALLLKLWKEGGVFAQKARVEMAIARQAEAVESLRAELKEAGGNKGGCLAEKIDEYSQVEELRSFYIDMMAHENSEVRLEAARAVIAMSR